MPKPSDNRLRQYPSLREIPEDEWDEVFDNDGKDWTTSDLFYLQEWITKETIIVDRKENIVDLAYQLGRTPYSIQDTIRRMRADGWDVPYLRKGKANGKTSGSRSMSGSVPTNDDGQNGRRRSR